MSEKMLNAAGHRCRGILLQTEGVPIIFFHGFSYTSEVWQRIGVIDLLTEKHVPFLALDMPYGSKSECQPKTRDIQKNVNFANKIAEKIFGEQKPIIVGASLGGHIALQYAARFVVKGLLLVAPSGVLEETLVHSLIKFNFPVRIIWGSEDNIISGEEMRILTDKITNAKLLTYEGGKHSAYVSQPSKFKRDLLELYASVE